MLLGAVDTLRAAMLIFATGPNWAQRFGGYSWFTKKKPSPLIWVGEGNPQELADKVLQKVFGKEYSKQ